MKRFIVLAFMVIAACRPHDFSAEKELFYNEASKRGCLVMPVDMYFARLDSDIAGYCVPAFGILINETMWARLKDYQRKELVFHELGHCAMGKEHTDLGIMAPSMHSEAEMEIMWDVYVDLLFKDCLTIFDLLAPKDEKEPL